MLKTPLNTLLLCSALMLSFASQAQAYAHTFCVINRVVTTDSEIGEDLYAAAGEVYHHSRYAQMRVKRNGVTVLPMTYANELGCVTFNSPFSTGFDLEMWSKARIPRSDQPAQHNYLHVRYSNNNLAKWTFHVDPGPVSASHAIFTPASRVANLLGISSWALSLNSPGFSGKEITVKDQACPQYPDNSCHSLGVVSINPTHVQKKFLIAHELGHAVAYHYAGNISKSYVENTGGADCETPVDWTHALHSKEYQSAAIVEGYAHFYSAATWNINSQTNGWFHYYKSDYKNGSVIAVSVENGPTGGDTNYMENHCTGSDAGHGTELDWMRALWDYRTNSGAKPSHAQILSQLEAAATGPFWTNTLASQAFLAAIDEFDNVHGTSFEQRWIQMASWNGLLH